MSPSGTTNASRKRRPFQPDSYSKILKFILCPNRCKRKPTATRIVRDNFSSTHHAPHPAHQHWGRCRPQKLNSCSHWMNFGWGMPEASRTNQEEGRIENLGHKTHRRSQEIWECKRAKNMSQTVDFFWDEQNAGMPLRFFHWWFWCGFLFALIFCWFFSTFFFWKYFSFFLACSCGTHFTDVKNICQKILDMEALCWYRATFRYW